MAPPATPASEEGRALYRQVTDAAFDHYAREEYAEALDAIQRYRVRLQPWDSELSVIAACLHARSGRAEDGLRELEGATERGGWWNPQVLAADDDLVPVRARPGFETVIRTAALRWSEANQGTDRSGDLLVESSSPRCLILALHGAEEEAHDAVRAWGSIATRTRSCLLAVRSSQRTSPAYRTWTDHDRAVHEIHEAWNLLPDRTRTLPIVAAGFSAGGRVALRWALEAAPPPTVGVLAVAPAVDVGDLSHDPPAAPCFGQVWIGSEDDLLPQVSACRPRLAQAGVDLAVIDGLGHGFPDDFEARATTLVDAALR